MDADEICFRGTLLISALDVFMKNLARYSKDDLSCIKTFPFHVKTLIVRKFLSSYAFSRDMDLAEFMNLVIHDRLTELDLTLYNVNNATLLVFKDKCPNLLKFRLDEWGKDTTLASSVLQSVLSTFPNLIELLIQNCEGVTDEVAASIAQHCTKLRKLNLFNCKNITDEGVINLCNLKNLIALDISGSQISDNGLQATTNSPFMKNIEDIRLDNCRNIQNFDITEFASKSPELAKFSCEGSPIADKMNHWNSRNLKNLRQINWTIEW